jgi:large subunit ribosomal protein L15
VGRGIAAGKGKTAGRGTKGQKSRAGGSIPPWFEGGQTPLHRRIPKLRGFKNRGRIEYEIVNVGELGRLAEQGAFAGSDATRARGTKTGPPTVNQDNLREAGVVRTLARPLKVLGQGEIGSPLFVVADAFSRSAVAKIEAAGGSVSVLERITRKTAALGVGADAQPAADAGPQAAAEAGAQPAKSARGARKRSTEPAGDAAVEAQAEVDAADEAAGTADAEPADDTGDAGPPAAAPEEDAGEDGASSEDDPSATADEG